MAALPQYYLLAGKAEIPLYVGGHEDGYAILYSDKNRAGDEQVLDQETRTFRLSEVADETSALSLKVPFRVVSRLQREKVIVDHSSDAHAEFEAFPRVTSIDEDEDAFDLFVVHEPTPHGDMQFRMKFEHEPDEENDEMHLKFHSFKLLVPENAFETVLEDESVASLLVMIKGHEIVSHSAREISAELGEEQEEEEGEQEDPDQKLIGAGIKQRFSKAKSAVKGKASSAKRSVKSKFSSAKGKFNSAKGKVKGKFNSAKGNVKGKVNNFRTKANNKFTGMRNKLTGRRPNNSGGSPAGGRKPPPIPPKPNRGGGGGVGAGGNRAPPNKPLPPTPGGKNGAPNKPLPPVPGQKPIAGSPKQPHPPAGKSPGGKQPGKQPGKKPSGKPSGKPGQQGGGKSGGGKQGGGEGGGGHEGGGGGGGHGGGEGEHELEEAGAFGAGVAGGEIIAGSGGLMYAGGYPAGGVYPYGGVPLQPGMIGYPTQPGLQSYQQQPGGVGQQTYQPQMNNGMPNGQASGVSQNGGGAFPQQQQYNEARFPLNYVPEEAPIKAELTLEDVVSRRKRIVNKVAEAYEAKMGHRPTQQSLDVLHSRLDSKVILTTNAILDIVVDWLVEEMSDHTQVPPFPPLNEQRPHVAY